MSDYDRTVYFFLIFKRTEIQAHLIWCEPTVCPYKTFSHLASSRQVGHPFPQEQNGMACWAYASPEVIWKAAFFSREEIILPAIMRWRIMIKHFKMQFLHYELIFYSKGCNSHFSTGNEVMLYLKFDWLKLLKNCHDLVLFIRGSLV